MVLDREIQQANAEFIAVANKFICVKIEMSSWSDPLAVQYGINSIPKILIFDQTKGTVIGEIPFANYQGNITKLRQLLNSASTW